MTLKSWHLALALAGTLLPVAAHGQSGPGGGNGPTVEISNDLDFGIAAHEGAGDGSIELDANSGARSISGGLVGVSGSWFTGQARITGKPFARVRIDLPQSIKMNARQGNKAVTANFTASVPPVATLDATGVLVFTFAGRLSVAAADEGDFRGRFVITATYE